MWGTVLKRDLLGETREEDKFHSKEQLKEYLKSEIERQGENVVILNLDVSLIEELRDLFINIADDVKTLDLSGWNTSNVKDMAWMFSWCTNLKSLNLSGWNTSNVKDMGDMFRNCYNLKSLDLSGWDTSNVENMSCVFFFCRSLDSLDLSGWDVSKVKDIRWIFNNCESLKSLDLSGWDKFNFRYINDIFYNCPAPYIVFGNTIERRWVRKI